MSFPRGPRCHTHHIRANVAFESLAVARRLARPRRCRFSHTVNDSDMHLRQHRRR